MEISDTIIDMVSDDYKERFRAEYHQTKIRYDRLKTMLDNWKTLDFVPVCPRELLERQANAMSNYLECLKARAEKEGIKL